MYEIKKTSDLVSLVQARNCAELRSTNRINSAHLNVHLP